MEMETLSSIIHFLSDPELERTGTNCHLSEIKTANKDVFINSLNQYELIGLKTCFRICQSALDQTGPKNSPH